MSATALEIPAGFTKIDYHAGENYIAVLERLHTILRPRSYLEIGTQLGSSLAVSKCASIAVDPNFIIASNVFTSKPQCHLFQMGSDDFFKENDPTAILKRPLDMSFLDGMHLFEFLLRDFINVERYSQKNSLIAMHDCIPNDSHVARRDMADNSQRALAAYPDHWAGDVWKTLQILRKYRSDLRIIALDAPPTGLILVTNLDPSNDTLRREYFSIVADASSGADEFEFSNFIKSLPIRPTSSLKFTNDIHREFWI